MPVAACRSVGIRTRGRTAAGVEDPTPRPVVGGDRLTLVLHEWTRLEATTERAFLVSSRSFQRPGYRRGLSFLPGVRTGSSSAVTWATRMGPVAQGVAITAHQPDLSSTFVVGVAGAVSRLYRVRRLHRAEWGTPRTASDRCPGGAPDRSEVRATWSTKRSPRPGSRKVNGC